jgi:hypothetical protein
MIATLFVVFDMQWIFLCSLLLGNTEKESAEVGKRLFDIRFYWYPDARCVYLSSGNKKHATT